MKKQVVFDVEIPRKSRLRSVGLAIAVGCLLVWHSWYLLFPVVSRFKCSGKRQGSAQDVCPKVSKITPSDEFDSADQFFTSAYRDYSLAVWAGAVQIPSQSFDDLGDIGEDDRWRVFGELHKFLEKSFPVLYENAQVEHVNTYGLLFTIKGTDESLKPILLMAHQDVVPVPDETVSRWTHPPFGGYFDGTFLWGRGSFDCKNTLIGILEAVCALLKQGFQPQRTVILSFGFDEEASGHQGAGKLAPYLEKKLGKDSLYMIVDEGDSGVQHSFGNWYGFPSTGEKGYLDLRVRLQTPGGHSSVPPDHTAIGIISQVVSAIENNPYLPDITAQNPFFYHLQCLAKNGGDLGPGLRDDILHLNESTAAKGRVIEEFQQIPRLRYVMQTSQAVDIINGGLKINALPEEVTVDVNYRVAVESSLDAVKEKLVNIVSQVASDFDFAVNAFGSELDHGDSSRGMFNVTLLSELEPAPVTPHLDNPTWELLGGTIRHVFEDLGDTPIDSEVTVAPSIMTGNTDTRYYWSLTTNIYRFTPMRDGQAANLHSIDERTALEEHLMAVAFYYELLRSMESHSAMAGSKSIYIDRH
jgi:Gly-Xaa carboxypeptidase